MQSTYDRNMNNISYISYVFLTVLTFYLFSAFWVGFIKHIWKKGFDSEFRLNILAIVETLEAN